MHVLYTNIIMVKTKEAWEQMECLRRDGKKVVVEFRGSSIPFL